MLLLLALLLLLVLPLPPPFPLLSRRLGRLHVLDTFLCVPDGPDVRHEEQHGSRVHQPATSGGAAKGNCRRGTGRPESGSHQPLITPGRAKVPDRRRAAGTEDITSSLAPE